MSDETQPAATWGELVTLIARWRAAEQVIEAARRVNDQRCSSWEGDDEYCAAHHRDMPCPHEPLRGAIADYDQQTGR